MPSSTLVISEVYGDGGGNTGSLYANDYIEIINISNSNIDLSNYYVQRANSSTGTEWSPYQLSGTLSPGQHYLIQAISAGNGGATNPTADLIVNFNIGQLGGKYAITSSSTPLSGANPTGPQIIDLVGYGGNANGFEGSGASAPQGQSITRLNEGTSDSDNNNADFVLTTPNPQNRASPNVACYLTGTHIRTPAGKDAVEHLRGGDLIVNAAGEHRPVRWVGHRTIACHGRKDVLPVRIAAHAFGEGRPARDLYVSPAHAIAVDVLGKVLIPACRLINGTTITQVDLETVTYWHVELDSHDILLAEGLPAESYLDCGNRRFFANADATDLLTAPDARPEGPMPFCRPFHEAGPVVDLVRARLEARAVALGWQKVEHDFAGLHLVADGRTIRSDVEGLTARFVVPADARDVRLISETSVPAHVVQGSSDDRHLGVALAALSIDDGLTGARHIELDDARLGEGFYAVDGGARWTDGAAALTADLWDGCKGSFFLRMTLAGPALPRWIAPGQTSGVVDLADRRQA